MEFEPLPRRYYLKPDGEFAKVAEGGNSMAHWDPVSDQEAVRYFKLLPSMLCTVEGEDIDAPDFDPTTPEHGWETNTKVYPFVKDFRHRFFPLTPEETAQDFGAVLLDDHGSAVIVDIIGLHGGGYRDSEGRYVSLDCEGIIKMVPPIENEDPAVLEEMAREVVDAFKDVDDLHTVHLLRVAGAQGAWEDTMGCVVYDGKDGTYYSSFVDMIGDELVTFHF